MLSFLSLSRYRRSGLAAALLLLLLSLSTAVVRAEDDAGVIPLTDDTFEHLTQASTGQTTGKWFVKFFAPWCGHCKRMAGTWKELAAIMETKHAEQGVVIAEVDSTVNRAVTERFGVKGYPTLKYIAGGKVYTYKGDRSLDDMEKFVLEGYLDMEGDEVPSPPSFIEIQRKKFRKFVKENHQLNMLMEDFDHIYQLRKNAAVIFVVFGFILGIAVGLILGSLRGGSKKSASTSSSHEKKD